MAKETFQMIKVIAEHSVDLSLLPERANILDLGARGFLFTRAMMERGHHVFPVDADHLNEGHAYYQCAVSDYDGTAGTKKTADPQATTISKHSGVVPCYTLTTLTQKLIGNNRWDLIKMDIEGSEKDVILSLDRKIATQLSIEFHLHTGKQTEADVEAMVAKLTSLGYKAVSHKKTSQHGAGLNFWDSLFVLEPSQANEE